MAGNLRRDVDFSGIFRKLGHSLEEIRVRALENILSKLEHQLICDADIVHEKHLYIRLLEWFNFTDCPKKADVFSLLNRLAQHSAGAQLIQDIGGVEFLSQLRQDIEACHRPVIDQILESAMRLPDSREEGHAAECIYQKPSESAVWGASMTSTNDGSRSHLSHPSEAHSAHPAQASIERLGRHNHAGPGYFASTVTAAPLHTKLSAGPETMAPSQDLFMPKFANEGNNCNLFRLSTFPWLPLTHTDQQVIASTNSSLQTKDPNMLIGACEFLADVVFQDFPAELFLQRPEILKNLLSLVSLTAPAEHPVVIQACHTLSAYVHGLQVRIRYFQDPVLYTSKQELNSSSPSLVSSTSSSTSHLAPPPGQGHAGVGLGDRRHRGDGQDGDSSVSASRESSLGLEPSDSNADNDLDLDDGPRLQSQQLTLPQFCVAVLQRALPRLRTAHESLGVSVLELLHGTLTILSSVLDAEVWSDLREPAREVVDRLTDCLDQMCELLGFHHHSNHAVSPINAELGDLSTHRVLYTGLVTTMTRFLLMVPLEKMGSILPEKLKSTLHTVVYDEALAMSQPRCRAVSLAVANSLGLSVPVDYQRVLDVCSSLAKTCVFCLQCETESLKSEELAELAEASVLSLNYHLHLPFVTKFVAFTSKIYSKKKSRPEVLCQCRGVLLQLMAYPNDSVRQACYAAVLAEIKKSLQVNSCKDPKSKAYLGSKFMMNADVLYELSTFGLADTDAKVRTSATDCLHHLLQSQLLMSEGLWQEFMLALTKSLPILQSYTDQSTALGRLLWSMLDPTTSSHNVPLLDKLRGSLRLLYLSDKTLRTQASKHVRWFLSNEQDTEGKMPATGDLEPTKIDSCLILSTPVLIDDDPTRSVFTEEGMKQVFDIFTADPVDPGVKKSASEQLAIMLKDPHLHALFKSHGGVEIACSVIQQSVMSAAEEADSKQKPDTVAVLPACLSMLHSLARYDYTLRHTLSRDSELYHCLVRVSLLHQSQEQIKSDVSHILTLLLFDEVAKFDIGSGQANVPGTRFSLPAQVIKRYRLPFKPACHHISSPNAASLPDSDTDVMALSGPREMMRAAWNVAWQGGLHQLLDSFSTRLFSDTASEFSSSLALSPIDRTVLKTSSVSWMLQAKVKAIEEATSHSQVVAALDRISSYVTGVRIPAVSEFFCSADWYSALEKFLQVTPSSASDQSLLLQILRFISAVLRCVSPRLSASGPATPPSPLSWLVEKLYQPNSPLVSLMARPFSAASSSSPEGGESGSHVKRSLDKELLHYITSINNHFPYQLCQRARPGQVRGDLVRKLQHRLNITDAPHFYNLASLEGTLACLMHVTARPGWCKQCSELDATSLCSQLLNSLLEVVWSFHIGRGGTSRSFMGKGVTKSTALCLRHLAHEMINNSEDQEWVKNWLYTRRDSVAGSDQGLDWLLTLWAYRDAEVRAAGVGIAVALTSCEAGRLLVAANSKHVPGGVWAAAFSILLDPSECSMVCQQAALLLVNLTSQSMPSGDLETGPGTWQGPLVTDTDYQVMLVGEDALIALLSHTNFYSVAADLLTSLYTPSVIQPILVTTELPLVLESTANSSLSSSDASSLDRTGATALTSVSSLSTHPTPNITARSKTLSTDRSKASGLAALQENSLSSSSNMETPRGSQGDVPQERVHARPATTVQTTVPEGQNIATPGVLCAVVKLMTNLVNLTPQRSLSDMKSHSLITSLLNAVDPGLVQVLCEEMTAGQMGSASALNLMDFLRMYGAVADLLTSCVVLDTNTRMELLRHSSGLTSLASLLLLQWREKDDLGEVCLNVSVSVLDLLTSLLQTAGQPALTTLTSVVGQIWAPLTESLGCMLEENSSSRATQHAACLNFLGLLCCEEAKSLVKNPDRICESASLSELLDAPLCVEEAGTESGNPEEKTAGRLLCKVLVGLFDTVTSSAGEEKRRAGGQRSGVRLRVVSTLKSLLAVSQSAKVTALGAGLVESTIEHIKQTHAQLSLETLGMVKSGGKKEEPFLQEIIIMFDFLRNFMCGNADVKVACFHSGLTTIAQRLWSWCQEDPALMSSALSLLMAYTAHCDSAASSLTTTMSAQTTGKTSGQGSLLHYILRLAQRELDRDECSPTLRQAFTLLTNLVLSAECRNVLWKNSFLNQFSNLNPRRKRGKVRVVVETLWCELLLALSFSVDGQQIILKIPDVLTVLLDMMEVGSTRCQHCATLIVRNLCCHAPNKPKLLAADKLVSMLVQQIEKKEEGSTQLVASSALWALVYNNHKARVQVKSASVAPRLAESLHDLQASGSMSQVTVSSCENLKAIINAVRD